MGQSPFRKRKERVKREEVERRVKDDNEEYSSIFSENAQKFCQAVIEFCRLDSFTNLPV